MEVEMGYIGNAAEIVANKLGALILRRFAQRSLEGRTTSTKASGRDPLMPALSLELFSRREPACPPEVRPSRLGRHPASRLRMRGVAEVETGYIGNAAEIVANKLGALILRCFAQRSLEGRTTSTKA
ncbi:MAG: hypothetical protein GY797_04390 [Deltaproteobacteria bacterium]|nr:hypothetical protein [Deltaproteobacteria bacterium]